MVFQNVFGRIHCLSFMSFPFPFLSHTVALVSVFQEKTVFYSAVDFLWGKGVHLTTGFFNGGYHDKKMDSGRCSHHFRSIAPASESNRSV